MRILRVSHSAVVDSWRERERVLRDRGHRVALVSADRWAEGGQDVPLAARSGEDVVGARTVGRHPALFVYDPRPLWRALGQPVDVIDVHEEPFALATAEVLLLRWLRRQRAPYVLYTAQNIDKRYPVPFRWIERAALRGARGVSACNAAAARIAERKGFPGRASTIDLGTDLATLPPGRSRDRRSSSVGMRARGPVVGYAGRLDPSQGCRRAVAGCGHRPRPCACASPATARSEPRSRRSPTSSGSADRVEFIGPLAPEALPDFYRSLDALAVPSRTTTSWVEQFGRVALEAMACGTPVVVSDSGALPGVVDGAALVVPEGDPAALAKGLQQATRGLGRALAGCGPTASPRRRSSWDQVATAYERALSVAAQPSRLSRPTAGLEVVVVAYGQPALLARALAPLDGLSVTVVDNSSSPEVRVVVDSTGRALRRSGPQRRFRRGGQRRVCDGPIRSLTCSSSTPMPSSTGLPSRRCAPRWPPTADWPAWAPRSSTPTVGRPGSSGRSPPVGHLGRRRGSGAVAPQLLRHRVGAPASPRGPRPRRALRRGALLPLRRGDRLGLPGSAARVATPRRRRRARRARGRRDEHRRRRAARGTSSLPTRSTCASTTVPWGGR